MKKLLPFVFVCITSVFLMSCSSGKKDNFSAENQQDRSVQKSEKENLNAPVQDENPAAADPTKAVSSSAAVEKGSDTNRKFIRTADLRFRVPDAIRTTYKIEDLTIKNGGFVAYSNLTSRIDYENNEPLTADSSLNTTHFTITNTLTLRVPNTKLDTMLKQLAPLIEFLDYRTVKATDVAIDMLTNRLMRIRAQKHNASVSSVSDSKSSKGQDVISAAESILSSQERADQALISDLTLQDQINFSTINLEVYQKPSVKYTVIANEKNSDVYQPGFWRKAAEALKTGFDVFKVFILFILQIWWLIAIFIAGYFLYPRFKNRKLKKQKG